MLTPEQIAERQSYLGGSDAAAAVGISRWTTPLKLWAIKTGQFPPDDLSDNEAVEMGNELEDSVARIFTRRTGKKLHRVNETIFHPKYPFLAANLDRRVVGEDAIAEIKTCSAWKEKEFEGQDIPSEYICQMMHYLACTGKNVAYLAVLIGGQQFRWKMITRDDALIDDLIKKEIEFWTKYVIPKVMPMTVTAKDADTLYNLFPVATEDSITLDDQANALIESIQAMKEDGKAIEAQQKKAENELRLLLKDHSEGVTDKWKVSWKNQETHRVNLAKLKIEQPDICTKYADTTASRVLRIALLKSKQKEG